MMNGLLVGVNQNRANKPHIRATTGVDLKTVRLNLRWRRAHPFCPDCGEQLNYLLRSETWICLLHGQQWTGSGLASARGFLLKT